MSVAPWIAGLFLLKMKRIQQILREFNNIRWLKFGSAMVLTVVVLIVGIAIGFLIGFFDDTIQDLISTLIA